VSEIRELYLVRGLVEYESDAYNVPCLDLFEVRRLLKRLAEAGSTTDNTEVERWRFENGQGEIVALYRVNWTTFALVQLEQFVSFGRGEPWDRHATPWSWEPRETFDDQWARENAEKRERGEV
jgi:hypothetical protein